MPRQNFVADSVVGKFSANIKRDECCKGKRSAGKRLEEMLFGKSVEGMYKNNRDDEALTISTIHSAKGLEWDSVFIIGERLVVIKQKPEAENKDECQKSEIKFVFEDALKICAHKIPHTHAPTRLMK